MDEQTYTDDELKDLVERFHVLDREIGFQTCFDFPRSDKYNEILKLAPGVLMEVLIYARIYRFPFDANWRHFAMLRDVSDWEPPIEVRERYFLVMDHIIFSWGFKHFENGLLDRFVDLMQEIIPPEPMFIHRPRRVPISK